ncbi:MAG TPA: head GIN domain-containing protein [Chitinophagaceae bacterium]|nr:head GIN domain-containing protein [Chitinophagaceae bacterium]
MKKLALFSFVILLFASGCREIAGRRVRGNGHITTETRTASNFNSIDVGGAIDVYVRQDSAASIKIEADENLHEFIEVHTSGSTLEIHTQRGARIRPTHKIRVYVSNPSFREFEVSGASSIRSETEIVSNEMLSVNISGASEGRLEFNAPKVYVDLSGASNVSIKGKTKDLEADASGASKIKCFDLLSENTDIEVSGASSAEVYASVRLAGSASGASSVKYKGNATSSVSSSGASGVNKVD